MAKVIIERVELHMTPEEADALMHVLVLVRNENTGALTRDDINGILGICEALEGAVG